MMNTHNLFALFVMLAVFGLRLLILTHSFKYRAYSASVGLWFCLVDALFFGLAFGWFFY